MNIREIVKQRILILDGAMGTMIQGYDLTEEDFRGKLKLYREPYGHITTYKGNNDMLNLTKPDLIANIHHLYLDAGADMIETNTFSAQRISQADYHLEDYAYEINLQGARLARKEADRLSSQDKPRFVLGSIGPTNKTCSMSPDVSDPAMRALTYDDLFEAYAEQVRGLLDGAVDGFLIETIFDTLNAKVAIDAVKTEMGRRSIDLPIMLSVTISDLAGRTLSGQTLEAFLASIEPYDVFSVGLNCSFGPRQMKPYLEELARKAPYYISAYPNAGMPNSMGLYDETADSMAPLIEEFMTERLVNIIGGCCGTTDEFIRHYTAIAPKHEPHERLPKSSYLCLSGLEPLEVSPEVNFVNVGERCNVAGSRKFLRLIKEKNYDEAVSIARKQVADGALVLDVNMDDGLLDAKTEMVHFLNMIASEPDIAKVPLMIDSSNWDVIKAGLKCCQGKSIVNSISLKEGEEKFIKLASDVKRYGAAVVVMCFDEKGQATTYERKIEIAARAYRILTEDVKMNPLNIIFDPNILSIATGMEEHDNYAVDYIRACGWIRKHLSGAHVSGGVSNLSFSFRGNDYIREAMHAVFLYHAIQNGMDFGIVNPSSKVIYTDIPQQQLEVIENVVLNRKKDAAETLIDLANELKKQADLAKSDPSVQIEKTEESWRKDSLEDRLKYALRKGIGDYLEEDLKEALKKYPKAVNIIQGPLMTGMNEVGELFGAGKMFLPQVVKTARTMKQAVSILQPVIEAEKTEGSTEAGKVILATVKGDVHDIGKNIVGVVMACNNYKVIDMGVMVPADQIVKKAIEEHADAVGLSGLITPSLEEMVNVAKEMDKAGLHIPIMIGGATTSELHVALKIAPVYRGPVAWMRDAAQNVVATSRMLNKEERVRYVHELDDRYEQLRKDYQQDQQKLLDIEEARKNKLNLFDNI